MTRSFILIEFIRYRFPHIKPVTVLQYKKENQRRQVGKPQNCDDSLVQEDGRQANTEEGRCWSIGYLKTLDGL